MFHTKDIRKFLDRVGIVGSVVASFLLASSLAGASGMTGAVFTTDVACSGTNVNLFASKADVYLDGGPHHTGSAGLPDGNYYVRVTNPNGSDILGTSVGSIDDTPAHVVNGSFSDCYQLQNILVKGSDGITSGYDDTTNGGGVYKVWVCADAGFQTCKTDNFKVGSNDPNDPPSDGSISGMKWQDDNADGVKDISEVGLENWTIQLYDATHTMIGSAVTDSNGGYIFGAVTPGTYQVCEVMMDTTQHASYPTTSDPNCHTGVVVTAGNDTGPINFGNYQNATLTVIKHVINDNGGTAVAGDFTMNVSGVADPSSFAGDEAGVTVSVKPGAYGVTESGGPFGYQMTSSENCSGTLTSGQSVICTITNDDIQPKLVVVKHVINDNTGSKNASNFTMNVTGPSASPTSFPGSETGTTVMLNAGSYSADETNDPGYQKSLSADCSGTISVGQVKTCTITNDDIPPTRTQGFWSTHLNLSDTNWALVSSADKNVCSKVGITSSLLSGQSQLMGGFWSDIAKKTIGAKRTDVDQAKMQMVQQYLAAALNKAAFGINDGGLLASARAACTSGNKASILNAAGLLGAFNQSGDNAPFPLLFVPGSANSTAAQKAADKGFWNTP